MTSAGPSWTVAVGIGLAVLAAGLVRGFSGFGAGMVLAPTLSLLLGPTRAVPIAVLLELVATARLLPESWSRIRWRLALSLGIPAAVTLPFGTLLLTGLDPLTVRRLISAAVLAFVGLAASGWRSASPPSLALLGPAGAVSGLLSGFGGVGGPPVVALVLSRADSGRTQRATLIGFFALTQVAASVVFAARGLVDGGIVSTVLLSAPVFWVGTHLGARAFAVTRESRYRRIVLAFLASVALVGLV